MKVVARNSQRRAEYMSCVIVSRRQASCDPITYPIWLAGSCGEKGKQSSCFLDVEEVFLGLWCEKFPCVYCSFFVVTSPDELDKLLQTELEFESTL